MEMASGEAAWGRAMGNCDGQEEEKFAREEGLEADTADIWKFVNHECTGAYGVAKGNLLVRLVRRPLVLRRGVATRPTLGWRSRVTVVHQLINLLLRTVEETR
jgi:hypothetical protein